jgi:hypothetical protein
MRVLSHKNALISHPTARPHTSPQPRPYRRPYGTSFAPLRRPASKRLCRTEKASASPFSPSLILLLRLGSPPPPVHLPAPPPPPLVPPPRCVLSYCHVPLADGRVTVTDLLPHRLPPHTAGADPGPHTRPHGTSSFPYCACRSGSLPSLHEVAWPNPSSSQARHTRPSGLACILLTGVPDPGPHAGPHARAHGESHPRGGEVSVGHGSVAATIASRLDMGPLPALAAPHGTFRAHRV